MRISWVVVCLVASARLALADSHDDMRNALLAQIDAHPAPATLAPATKLADVHGAAVDARAMAQAMGPSSSAIIRQAQSAVAAAAGQAQAQAAKARAGHPPSKR